MASILRPVSFLHLQSRIVLFLLALVLLPCEYHLVDSAAALGEPLLQGLNEIASNKPEDPVGYLANFLYNFSTSEPAAGDTQVSGGSWWARAVGWEGGGCGGC